MLVPGQGRLKETTCTFERFGHLLLAKAASLPNQASEKECAPNGGKYQGRIGPASGNHPSGHNAGISLEKTDAWKTVFFLFLT